MRTEELRIKSMTILGLKMAIFMTKIKPLKSNVRDKYIKF